MKLQRLAVMTKVMRKGIPLRDFFPEAVRCNVPGLPLITTAEDDQPPVGDAKNKPGIPAKRSVWCVAESMKVRMH